MGECSGSRPGGFDQEGAAGLIIVVMGVSGAGKTTLGRALAGRLGWDFIEGDDHHSPRAVEKMRAGEPLSDSDRRPWLEALHDIAAEYSDRRESVVLACSALKGQGREILTQGLPDVRFVFLHGHQDVIRQRMVDRERHFVSSELLASQIAELEAPDDAFPVPVDLPTEEQIRLVRRALDI